MPIRNALASVAVSNISAASQWYEQLFGRPADSKPMPELAEWKFERGGWLQVYEQPKVAGKGSVTLAVSDLAEQAEHLDNMGVDTSHRSSSPLVNTLMITDPDGNHIAFAQAIDPHLAQ
jgi:predicted enzyme related to lactoylglutathione lyase